MVGTLRAKEGWKDGRKHNNNRNKNMMMNMKRSVLPILSSPLSMSLFFFFIIFGCCTHMYNLGLQIMLLRRRTCRQPLARQTQRSDYWVFFLFKIRNLGLYSWV